MVLLCHIVYDQWCHCVTASTRWSAVRGLSGLSSLHSAAGAASGQSIDFRHHSGPPWVHLHPREVSAEFPQQTKDCRTLDRRVKSTRQVGLSHLSRRLVWDYCPIQVIGMGQQSHTHDKEQNPKTRGRSDHKCYACAILRGGLSSSVQTSSQNKCRGPRRPHAPTQCHRTKSTACTPAVQYLRGVAWGHIAMLGSSAAL